jgi:hypothetical protein
MFIEQTKIYQHITAETARPDLLNELLKTGDSGPGEDDDDDYEEEDTDELNDAEPDLHDDMPPLDENDLEDNDLTVDEADNIEWEPDTEEDDDEETNDA